MSGPACGNIKRLRKEKGVEEKLNVNALKNQTQIVTRLDNIASILTTRVNG